MATNNDYSVTPELYQIITRLQITLEGVKRGEGLNPQDGKRIGRKIRREASMVYNHLSNMERAYKHKKEHIPS